MLSEQNRCGLDADFQVVIAGDGKTVDAAVLDRRALDPGQQINSPAIIIISRKR